MHDGIKLQSRKVIFQAKKNKKNELRSKMSQERLTHMSLMSIEHELLKSLSFEEIITDFARRKVRKRPFLNKETVLIKCIFFMKCVIYKVL